MLEGGESSRDLVEPRSYRDYEQSGNEHRPFEAGRNRT
jgi:hypothetical protein